MDWKCLPKEILGQIFTCLPRKDQLAFILVCQPWEDSTDTPMFWKKITVKIDEDFYEPSLIFLTQKYYKYIKTLDIGWASPVSHSSKLSYMRYKDIIKRVGRFLVLLFERQVQLQHLTIFDWYDIYHLRKLSYLLMRFVKQQHSLQTVTLNNANLYDMSFVNILITCLRSKAAMKHIHLHYSTYNSRKLFDSWVFTNCMELFYNLEVLTIDCWIFWQFFNKIRICRLKEVNLYLDDTLKKFETMVTVRETQWEMFFAYLPRATVTLKVEKSLGDEQFRHIIHKHYPLMSFSWNYPYYRETCQMDCCQCLERLANLQSKNLEFIRLTVPLQQSHVSEKINYVKRKCRNVKSFIFNNVELIQRKNYFESPAKTGEITFNKHMFV